MSETARGIKTDLKNMKRRIVLCIFRWFLKWISKTYKKPLRSPIDVLWEMIDAENKNESPDCVKIEAWNEAIDRISDECLC